MNAEAAPAEMMQLVTAFLMPSPPPMSAPPGPTHLPLHVLCARIISDVSIVRQLLENFLDASQEARSQLLAEERSSSWKSEDVHRLFYPLGETQETSFFKPL